MNTIVIDIETAPLTPEEQRPFEPEFAAPGNYKDPEKIEAKKQEAREKWHDRAQLDAMRCRVVAVGILETLTTDEAEPRLYIGGEESKLIGMAWGFIHDATQVCAHNIGYDLAILAQRSAILGLPIPGDLHAGNPDYYSRKFVDTKALWKPRAASVETPATLDSIGLALGFDRKPGNGKDFYTYDRAKQEEYLSHDLEVCAEIVNRMI